MHPAAWFASGGSQKLPSIATGHWILGDDIRDASSERGWIAIESFHLERSVPYFTNEAICAKGAAWALHTASELDDKGSGTPGHKKMNIRTYCVYNQTRECFLSLGVTAADTTFARLRGLIGRLKLRVDEGLWVVPSCGIHTLGVLFPLDLIYLDENHRVIHVVEHFPRFRVAPLRTHASSVLELPTHTIYSSQTQPGDQLLICAVEEIANRFNKGSVTRLSNQAQEVSGDLVYRSTAKDSGFSEIKE
jgi:uncharacterized membrane protein (UPF0127 family)